jgi:hypothetical protein
MERPTREVPLRRRLLPIASAWLLAIGLIGATSAVALAGPESGVDVVIHVGDTEVAAPGDPPTACTFHLHFQSAEAKTGYFDIRAGDEDGAVVADGTFDTTSGDSATGVFALDPGPYLITWDDETEVDRSFDEQAVEVVCETAPTPTPTGSEAPIGSESPSPTGSELPIGSENPTPTGSEAPIGGGPTGSVAGITVTPPATDTGAPGASGGSSAALPIGMMLGLTALLGAWAIRHRPRLAPRRVRARRR